MKKYLKILITIMMLLVVCPVNAFAATDFTEIESIKYSANVEGEFIANGYTEAGVYYEVYGEKTITRSSEELVIKRTVVYDGMMKPSSTLFWQENINGEMYSGTLQLIEFSFNNGTTTAVYQGTVYK